MVSNEPERFEVIDAQGTVDALKIRSEIAFIGGLV